MEFIPIIRTYRPLPTDSSVQSNRKKYNLEEVDEPEHLQLQTRQNEREIERCRVDREGGLTSTLHFFKQQLKMQVTMDTKKRMYKGTKRADQGNRPLRSRLIAMRSSCTKMMN